MSARTNYHLTLNGAKTGLDIGEQSPFGWSTGAGLDYLVSSNLFLRANYSYTQLGGQTYISSQPHQRFELNDFKLGIGYKF